MTPYAHEPRSGFTLLELLIVMVILAIAAAMVIPNISSGKDLEATSAARLITADLEYAQNMAITHQEPVTVTFSVSSESYTLSNTSGPLIHPMTKTAYTIALASQQGFSGLDIVSANFGGSDTVSFDEIGTPSNAGSVTVQSGASRYRIDVAAATGRVTVVTEGF